MLNIGSRRLVRFAAVLALALASAQTAVAAAAPAPERGASALVSADDAAAKADRILVVKHERRLYLLKDGRTLESFPIRLGHHPLGPKVKAGDGRTPEGEYVIDWRDDKSLFTLALHVSYPNARDRQRASRLHVDPGGSIEIHGEPFVAGAISPAKLRTDWTAGCIALSNADMRRVWDRVAVGARITIEP